MPINYKQALLTGEAWNRFNHIDCNNGHGQVPTIRFDEERRILLADGSSIGTPVRSIERAFVDPAATFPVYDVATGEIIPGATATHGQLYTLLYSLGMTLALEEDANVVEETP